MNLREQFQKLHPVPDCVYWCEQVYLYGLKVPAEVGTDTWIECYGYNSLWQGFQFGHAAGLEQQAKRITELEASLADAIEAQQVMGLKLAHAEGHSANTVGEREACPACGDDVEHVWCLISPEGKRFTGDTKMAAYREEASSRIPATEQLANIMRANAECEAEYQADLEQARKQGYQSGYAAGLEVNSANTVGGPTPDAAPACEQPLNDNAQKEAS